MLRACLLALLLAALPSVAAANVIWPAALLTGRLLTWWIIAASLVIETAFVWLAFRLTPLRRYSPRLPPMPSPSPSACSPCHFSAFFSRLRCKARASVKIDWDAFSPAGWIATFIIAVGFNLGIELIAYRYGFKLT